MAPRLVELFRSAEESAREAARKNLKKNLREAERKCFWATLMAEFLDGEITATGYQLALFGAERVAEVPLDRPSADWLRHRRSVLQELQDLYDEFRQDVCGDEGGGTPAADSWLKHARAHLKSVTRSAQPARLRVWWGPYLIPAQGWSADTAVWLAAEHGLSGKWPTEQDFRCVCE